MRFGILGLIVLFSVSAHGQPVEMGQPSSKVDSLVYEGYHLIRRNQLREAYKKFDKAIELNDSSHIAYYYRGVIRWKSFGYEDALSDFNKAVNLKPSDPDYRGERGILNARQGNYEKAEADLKYSLAHDSTNQYRHFNLGKFYLNRGNPEMAIDYFKSAMELQEDYLTAYFHRAKAYRRLDKDEKALYDLGIVIEIYQERKEYLEQKGASSRPVPGQSLAMSAYTIRAAMRLKRDKKKLACKDLEISVESNLSRAVEMHESNCE